MRDLAGLRVCFVAGTLGQGGAERQLYYILRILVEHGARPRVLCLTRGEFWAERIEALGVPITWVGRSGSRLQRLRRIVAELRRDPPDVVQSQHFYTNIYVAAAGRLLGIPDIGALRNDCISEVETGPRLLGLLSLRLPRTVAANSRVAIANAAAFGRRRDGLRFLPNVVDTRGFDVGTHRAAAGRPVRILGVGRLVAQKRFDRFLRVLARVRREAGVPVRAVIVGEGPLRSELETLAAQLGLGADALAFHGAAAAMAPHYRDADLLLLTSDQEGTPNVVLEAMATGLPVVATRAGGVEDLVPDGIVGALLDPWDEQGLSEAVHELLRDPARRVACGHSARQVVERQHALPQLERHLRALYGAVLGERWAPAHPGLRPARADAPLA